MSSCGSVVVHSTLLQQAASYTEGSDLLRYLDGYVTSQAFMISYA